MTIHLVTLKTRYLKKNFIGLTEARERHGERFRRGSSPQSGHQLGQSDDVVEPRRRNPLRSQA
jgi:hypothetical protein